MILQASVVDGYYPIYYSSHQPQQRRTMKPTHKSLIIWHMLAAAYFLCQSLSNCEKRSELVDLSHVFDNRTIYWVTARNLTLNVTHNGTSPNGDFWYQMDEIYASTHGGTHLDAPCHFARGRWCVSDIPLERLVVPAAIIDISNEVSGDPNVHLTTQHVLEWEKLHGRIPDGGLLLINFGWAKYWPDPFKYTGTGTREMSQLKFPSIKPDVARWLVSHRNVVGVGLDTMSLDIPNQIPETHLTLMENNIYGLENVNNLPALPPTGAMVYVMPMKLKDASGAPCRVVAHIPSGVANRCSCSHFIYVVALALAVLILNKI